MKMAERLSSVDQNELRVNTALVIIGLATAFVINRWELVAFQAGALFLTALHPSLGPHVAVYRHILRPAGIVTPDLRVDRMEPHRFATTFGMIVTTTAAYLLATGRSVAGWGLVWLLISLATVGFSGWCAGCCIYYTMNRLGFRRLFKHSPLAGTSPGGRPSKG